MCPHYELKKQMWPQSYYQLLQLFWVLHRRFVQGRLVYSVLRWGEQDTDSYWPKNQILFFDFVHFLFVDTGVVQKKEKECGWSSMNHLGGGEGAVIFHDLKNSSNV